MPVVYRDPLYTIPVTYFSKHFYTFNEFSIFSALLYPVFYTTNAHSPKLSHMSSELQHKVLILTTTFTCCEKILCYCFDGVLLTTLGYAYQCGKQMMAGGAKQQPHKQWQKFGVSTGFDNFCHFSPKRKLHVK